MSRGEEHRQDPVIQREEHISGDGGRDRKAVGLFAKDSLGDGTFELSAISTASGAVLSTTPASISGVNVDIGNVTLNPSPNQIGSVTIFGDINVTASSGNVTLNQGPNQIGSVTVSNFTTPNLGNVTLNQSPNFIGIVTVANPNAVSGNTTINQGPNQIGSVTISNTPSVTQSGSWDIRSALSLASIYGRVEQTNFTAPNVGNVTLNPSSSFIGIVTVANPNAVSGNTTINPGPNQIGSVTISNTPAVTQSGNWDIRSVLSTASIYGTVGISGTPNVNVTSLISLASGTEVKSVATVNQGAAAWRSVVTISPRTDYIGLMSISGNVAVSNWVSPNVGNVTLNASDAKIGLVTVANQIDVRSMLSTATIFAVVNTGAVGNTNALATLLAGPNQIGSVTISNFTAPNTGNVTLNPSPSFIGITTVANQPALVAGTAQIGSVTISNNPVLGTGTNFVGLATVTMSNSLSVGMTTLFGGPNQIGSVTIANQPPLIAGTAQIGSVTISNVVNSIVTIAPRTDFIGMMTVTTTNPGSGGMTTIFPGPNQIGSVTVSNFTAPNVGNVTLNASSAYIGIATVVPIISSTVVNFLVSTASGGKTQFPTNTVRQGIIQAYSENVSNVFIGNSAVTSGISDTRGMELQAGQAAGIEIDQTSKLYVALATGASGALSFFGSS